jgi:hypothetical protein
MALYSLNLYIAYTRGVKKSVGRVVKMGVLNFSGEARDDKGENDTQHGEGEGESGKPVAVTERTRHGDTPSNRRVRSHTYPYRTLRSAELIVAC